MMIRLWHSNLLKTIRNWEHWPMTLIQSPVYPYYLWLSIKARSLSFFSACNPGITMGGLFGESKYEILKKIPACLIPKSILIPYPATKEHVILAIRKNEFRLPLIFKPDMGEGGWMVEKISSCEEIEKYIQSIRQPFIIQEYVEGPIELGIFYKRLPSEADGKVISVTRKKFLTVTGDGRQTLKELILHDDRARLFRKKLMKQYAGELNHILEKGCKKILSHMGNHMQGATFYDHNFLINDKLHETFNRIAKSIDGFYYGKFDIRCTTMEDMYCGNIRILELNGCGATPSHIFEPGKSYFQCIKRLLLHWKDIYRISIENRKNGYEPIAPREAWYHFMRFMRAVGN